MARYFEPTPELERLWAGWVAERPAPVRAVAERFFPWELYRLTSTGQRVTLCSFSEDADAGRVTLTVNVSNRFNPEVWLDRSVFGVDPADVVPCELPS